jgi:protein-disulfide isomerase
MIPRHRLLAILALAATGAARAELSHDLIGRDPVGPEVRQMFQDLYHPRDPDLSGNRAVRGDRAAPVLLALYGSFTCAHCPAAYRIAQRSRARYGRKLAYVLKHYFPASDPLALAAATRFEAIALQDADAAYEYQDRLFADPAQLASRGEAFLDETAARLKIDVPRMQRDRTGPEVLRRIQADQAEAAKLGMRLAPGFDAGGIVIANSDADAATEEHVNSVIDDRLKYELKNGRLVRRQ